MGGLDGPFLSTPASFFEGDEVVTSRVPSDFLDVGAQGEGVVGGTSTDVSQGSSDGGN